MIPVEFILYAEIVQVGFLREAKPFTEGTYKIRRIFAVLVVFVDESSSPQV